MSPIIVCPVCGESNPPDMEFCRNCQSRLQPVEGDSEAIRPGQLPTKKNTSELEPLLPQWLREARQKARDTEAQAGAEAEAAGEAKAPEGDLLAGLASQASEEDEEVPDWLAQITGTHGKKKKAAPEETQVKWVELRHSETEQEPPVSDEAKSEQPSPERDALGDWFKQAAASAETADFQVPATPAQEASAPSEPAGAAPTENLEWLRNLQAASPAGDEAAPAEEAPAAAPAPSAKAPDWLKRLQDETVPLAKAEEPASEPVQANVPDWLKGLDESKSEPPQEPPAEETSQPSESTVAVGTNVPDWLKGLGGATAEPEPEAPAAEMPATEEPLFEAELPDWLKAAQPPEAAARVQPPAAEEPSFEAELPDWLSALPTPDATGSEPAEPQPVQGEEPTAAALPSWISSLSSREPQAADDEPAKPADRAPEAAEPVMPVELPGWLSSIQSGQQEAEGEPSAPPAPEAAEPAMPAELPDWLAALGSSQAGTQDETQVKTAPFAAEESSLAAAGAAPAGETPDWLDALRAEPEAAAQEPSAPAFEAEVSAETGAATPAELPGWLAGLRAQPEVPAEDSGAAPIPAAEAPAEPTPAAPAELPGWLADLHMPQKRAAEESSAGLLPAGETVQAAEEHATPISPAEAAPGEDADAISAAMETPDWLSAVLPTAPPAEEEAPAAAPEEEAIGPADLPSWVRAMRPVEAAMAAAPSAAQETPTEVQGPLAGLHGVLPAVPGAAAPSSKPKAYSAKLAATEQQQAHAALLERILAAETSPVPMRSTGEVLRTQRVLRWALSALVILVLGALLAARTQSFQLPDRVPNETVAAIQAIEGMPEGAPVLLVFDYQPATVGEMEATGASFVDHLLLLKHPNVALLSTSPTGPALAERFMSMALADRAYVRGNQYEDLGYLPGGLAGVYNFAQSPSTTVPLDAGAKPAWQSAVLAPVQRYSDFAAVIVLTDSVESGRTWVEQTQASRGNSLLLLVTSAQAGPMLLPYVDSGQVNGMVAGIYGASGTEQRNAGSPAVYGLPGSQPADAQAPGYVRRYWDSYSAGLYLAVISIVLGALVNAWLGLRDRRAGMAG